MRQLPGGWSTAPVGELTRRSIEQSGPAAARFAYIDISSIDNRTKSIAEPKEMGSDQAPSRARQRVRTGDVLVSMTRPNLNAVAIVPALLDGQVASTGFCVLRAADGIEPLWLFYLVQAQEFVEAMTRVVQGALYPAVRPKDVFAHEVPVPPHAEQRRIVAAIEEHLSRLDAAVAGLKRVQAQLPRYRPAVLKAAVEGRLAPTGTVRSDGNGLPTEWRWETVAALAERVDYGTSAKTAEAGDVPVLRMGNIREGTLVFDSLKYLPAGQAEFPNLLLRAGDVLFNRTNSAELVGKSAVYNGHPSPCSFASYLIRVRLRPDCLPEFLAAVLNSGYGRRWISAVVSQQVGQANVSGGKLKTFRIPLPPQSVQGRIVAEMERCMSLANAVERQVSGVLARAERLRHSVLRRAFSGRLVPQDPNDEPASVLLERIRTARAATPTKPPRPRRAGARC